MKLNKLAMGLAGGIVWGTTVFIATLWVFIRGSGETLQKLDRFYFGYRVSVGGAFIGLVYGFIEGFILALAFAALYNCFVSCKAKAPQTTQV